MRLAAQSRILTLLVIATLPGRMFPQATGDGRQGLPVLGSDLGLPSAAQAPLPTSGPSGGVADLTLQSYFVGGNSQPLTGLAGATTAFRDFFPGLGMITGNIEGYAQNTRGRIGENVVQLKGFRWKGRTWTFTAGDFRDRGSLVTLPFQNYYTPQIGLRGGQIESQEGHRTYSFFAGEETLSAGPRVSFRVAIPQKAAGASVTQSFGKMELAARYMHLSSPNDTYANDPTFYQAGREFRDSDSLTVSAYYAVSPKLKFYSDATLSHVAFFSGVTPAAQQPLSFLDGVVYDTSRITVRANYGSQSTSYLPILGLNAGDRRGPYAEVRLRLTKTLELFGNGALTRNNLERNPLLANLRAQTASGGASLVLPFHFNLSGQYSLLDLSSDQPSAGLSSKSVNSQTSATLTKPFGHHSIRLTVRELKLRSTIFNEKQPAGEVEDTFSVSRFTFGAAVRFQQVNSTQLQNSVFFRGSVNARLGRFTAYGQAELGNDLVNKSVFATSTVNTTVAGITLSDFKGWTFSVEAFRNSLVSQLNTVSEFALQTQGVGVSTLLSDLNQWSAYVRVTHRFKWGAPLPEATEHYLLTQVPLIGSLEGFVRLSGAGDGVAEVPVVLDGSRSSMTDATGHYRFDEVTEGPHRVEVSKLELPAEYGPNQKSGNGVVVHARKLARADLEVALLDCSIRGTVQGGESDSDNAGIAITLSPGNHLTTTDEKGRFTFYNLAAGEYQVTIDPGTLAEFYVLTSDEKVAVATSAAKTPAVSFTIEKREPQLPVRKVFVAQSNTIEAAPTPAAPPAARPAKPAAATATRPAAHSGSGTATSPQATIDQNPAKSPAAPKAAHKAVRSAIRKLPPVASAVRKATAAPARRVANRPAPAVAARKPAVARGTGQVAKLVRKPAGQPQRTARALTGARSLPASYRG